eukprot:8518702-Prorocentrum_lima.AAC.1
MHGCALHSAASAPGRWGRFAAFVNATCFLDTLIVRDAWVYASDVGKESSTHTTTSAIASQLPL